jgi:hypothetical protein
MASRACSCYTLGETGVSGQYSHPPVHNLRLHVAPNRSRRPGLLFVNAGIRVSPYELPSTQPKYLNVGQMALTRAQHRNQRPGIIPVTACFAREPYARPKPMSIVWATETSMNHDSKHPATF